MTKFSLIVVAVGLLMGGFRHSDAAVPIPTGLQPRDKYHLVFNSSTYTLGTSSDIAYYNNWVQQAADAAGIGASEGVTWRAITSTAAIDARNNAVVGPATPVYNMNLAVGHQRIATGFADMWDGTISATINYNENGSSWALDAWTGSNPNGTKAVGLTPGNANAWCGHPFFVEYPGNSHYWVQFLTPATGSTLLSVYALSQELTVPVPNSTLAGDYNDDGRVDAADYTVWRDALGSTTDWRADGNNDGVVSTLDYTHWKQRFGYLVPASLQLGDANAVPEPATAVTFLTIATIVGLRLRLRRAKAQEN